MVMGGGLLVVGWVEGVGYRGWGVGLVMGWAVEGGRGGYGVGGGAGLRGVWGGGCWLWGGVGYGAGSVMGRGRLWGGGGYGAGAALTSLPHAVSPALAGAEPSVPLSPGRPGPQAADGVPFSCT